MLVAALGWYMMSMEDEPGSGWFFSQHKSLGLLFGGLVLARLVWRMLNRPAALPSSVAKWQSYIAASTQMLLYVLMVLMPVSGYIGASYSKNGVQFFWFRLAIVGLTRPRHS
jgi:cytochrome b561